MPAKGYSRATLADILAIPNEQVATGTILREEATYQWWRYNGGSTAAADGINIGLPNDGVGRWFREMGPQLIRTVDFSTTVTANTRVTGTYTLSRCCQLLSLTSNEPCWLTFYADTSSRLADLTRLIGTLPQPGQGILADFALAAAGTLNLSPVPTIWGATRDIPITIGNTTNATRSYTLTATIAEIII